MKEENWILMIRVQKSGATLTFTRVEGGMSDAQKTCKIY